MVGNGMQRRIHAQARAYTTGDNGRKRHKCHFRALPFCGHLPHSRPTPVPFQCKMALPFQRHVCRPPRDASITISPTSQAFA
jgi:hypothetical protein